MPDDFDQEQEPGRLRQMYEDAAAARAAAEAQIQQLQAERSELLFRSAGLDPTNKLHAAAIRGFDGEISPESIHDYVADLGLSSAPPAPPEAPVPPQADADTIQRIAEAARDSTMVDPNDVQRQNREREIRDEMEKAYRRGELAKLDALSIELSRSAGNPTKWDDPAFREQPSVSGPMPAPVTQPSRPF